MDCAGGKENIGRNEVLGEAERNGVRDPVDRNPGSTQGRDANPGPNHRESEVAHSRLRG